MTDQALDKLARQLMLDAARLEYGEVLEGRLEHAFSPAFERRMKKLLRRGRHPVLYRALRAAACLLLALLLSGCAVLAVSPEAREAFEGWVRSVYYDTLVYTYTGPQGESPKDMLYRPLWLPEGYEVYDESPNLSLPMASYRNEAEEDITLITYGSVESMSLNIVMEEDVVEKQVLVAGKKADLYLDSGGGSSFLIWTDDEQHLMFVLIGHFTEKEALRIAESVRLMPLRTPPHRPGWIPEGYVCGGYTGTKTSFQIHYDREDGASIYFRYEEDGSLQEELQETLEGLTFETVQVDGQTARLYTDAESVRHLTWDGSKPGSDYWLSGPLSAEELIRIAESVGKQQE